MKIGLLGTITLIAFTLTSAVISGENVVRETRNVTGFTKVNFGISGDLYINIGSAFNVVLEGDKALLDDIITDVSGTKLVIKDENWHFHNSGKVKVYITMPAIEALGVSGSGKAEIRDAVKAGDLDFSVSGSGKILTGDVFATNLKIEISGSGDVIAGGSGEVSKADISISGSGSYAGESLRLADADFSISGSGSGKCYVTDNLAAHVSGSGNIIYSGNPKIDARVSGSGRVKSK